MSQSRQALVSARWIQDFHKHLYRRQHIILYGNIHDQFLWRGTYQSTALFLSQYFQELNFGVVVRYDPIDGLTFPQSEMRTTFDRLARQHLQGHSNTFSPDPTPIPALDSASNPAPGSTSAQATVNPGSPPRRQGPGALLQGMGVNQRLVPEEAFGRLRSVMSQTEVPTVAVIDLGDMLTADPDRYGAEERSALMLLKKCTLEAAVIRQGTLMGYRNTVILLASDLPRVPVWFHANNPYVALVQVTLPNSEERQQFFHRFGTSFFGSEGLTPVSLTAAAEELAELTDGFQTLDLEALRHTSHRERIPLDPRNLLRLVDFYKFGQRDEPFEQLSPEKVHRVQAELTQAVIGQPRAVEAVTTMLTSAKVGISMSQVQGRNCRPKGVFFFVGPTGVGKTELAKSLTRLIFGDESAFARFDMSEYKEEHAAEKLAGAPPGFVGYEEGGHLTNRVLERPYSILLFDEIEKAHPKVLDKFLQILEDGRLTDGKGQTAYFNQTVIIFTSNIGASDLSDPQSGAIVRRGIMSAVQSHGVEQFTYHQVESHFRQEVAWYFTSRIGRAELLNRLGDNIVVFDLLRTQFVAAIGQKFLRQLAASAQEKHGLTLTFLPSVLEYLAQRMAEADNALFGGRRIKTLLESLVERPLNRWLFEAYPELGQLRGLALQVGLEGGGSLGVHRE